MLLNTNTIRAQSYARWLIVRLVSLGPCTLPKTTHMHPTQVMTGDVHDVPAIISSKGGLKYAGPDVDAMRAVAKAYENRSLQEFQAALQVGL